MENKSYTFKKFYASLTERDIHPEEQWSLATYAGLLKGEERLEAITLIKNAMLSMLNSRDKRLKKTIVALESKELNDLYEKYRTQRRPQRTNPKSEKEYYKALLGQIEGKSATQSILVLDMLLKSLKSYTGKDNMMRKAIFKVVKEFPDLKGVHLKYQYVLGWSKSEVFGQETDILDLLSMHVVDSKSANYSENAWLLKYIDKQLKQVYHMNKCYYNGLRGYKSKKIHEQLNNFTDVGWKEKTLYNIKYTAKGNNCIGGKCPSEFIMPQNIGKIPFDYLGVLSKEDKAFSWLPFDFHIVCPLLLDNFEIVYLDYSIPDKPQLLNRSELEKCSFNEEIPVQFERNFKPTPFNLTKTFITYKDWDKRAAGVPVWLQSPETIKCPKSGNSMKFLFQLSSNNRIKTTTKSGIRYADTLNFWIDGCFYLFFEPNSKVAAMFIQNT